MIMKDIVQSVSQILYADREVNAFAVLDGASVPDLLENLYRDERDYVCLYRGDLQTDMAEVAPYLVRLDPNSELTDWIIGQGWGKHWGIFALSLADLKPMRLHFRRFLIVHDGHGKPLLFRYYDPRVLRVYLPTCNAEELTTVFGPVMSYILEDENPNTSLRFRTASGALQQEKLRLT